MNTDPDATVILCFGDSNTWGQKPDKTGRYPADVRWTGHLQDSLGETYYIIEEGLSSRTTDLEYHRPGRNGKTYFQPCLESHNPLDIVIIMLGTNDLKIEYDRSASEIAVAIKGLVDVVKEYGKDKNRNAPKIVLVSPILIDDTALNFAEYYSTSYSHNSAVRSHELPAAIKKVASELGCRFVDAASVAHPGDDGLHFDSKSHRELGELLAKEVKVLNSHD